jgi:hypothetical protein
MGRTCGTYGWQRRCIKDFVGVTWEDLDVDGRIILRWIFKKWDEGMDWVGVAQDRDRWRALVNAVMNFRVL